MTERYQTYASGESARIGDKVECIDSELSDLEAGAIYTVSGFYKIDNVMLESRRQDTSWRANRFKLVSRATSSFPAKKETTEMTHKFNIGDSVKLKAFGTLCIVANQCRLQVKFDNNWKPGYTISHLNADGQFVLADVFEEMLEAATPENPVTPERMLKHFDFAHLPAYLQVVSSGFYELACSLCAQVEPGPERTVALRKLLEAKDAAVRATVNPGC